MLSVNRLLVVLLLLTQLCSCGGGGGGGGAGDTSVVTPTGGTAAGGGDTGSSGAAGTPGSGGTGSSTGTDAGATPGSGGTGADPGSGGTGDVASVGAVDGFGSVLVNGVTYDDVAAVVTLNDAPALTLGMVIRTEGTLTTTAAGTARAIETGVEVIGNVQTIDLTSGTLVVAGQTVQIDERTALDGVSSTAVIVVGDPVFVYGLPGASGLHATRLEKRLSSSSFSQVTGLVQALDASAGTFQIATTRFDLRSSGLVGLTATDVVNGLTLKVRWSGVVGSGPMAADRVQRWLSPIGVESGVGQLRGTVSGFTGLASFKVLGAEVKADGAGVQFNVPSAQIGNGAEVQVKGHWRAGVLVAQQVNLITGIAGALPAYTLSGPMAAFNGVTHQFRVKGQLVSYDPTTVAITGGSLSDLTNGRKLLVSGSRVVNGALQATSITLVTP